MNIRLAIGNMERYVRTRKIVLLGDDGLEAEREAGEPLNTQLHKIFSHIEDLEEVNQRVRKGEAAQLYMYPVESEHSEKK